MVRRNAGVRSPPWPYSCVDVLPPAAPDRRSTRSPAGDRQLGGDVRRVLGFVLQQTGHVRCLLRTEHNGAGALCKSNTVVDRVSVGSPSPNDWFCGFVVQRPGKIFIGLYNGDGPLEKHRRRAGRRGSGRRARRGMTWKSPQSPTSPASVGLPRVRARWFRMERVAASVHKSALVRSRSMASVWPCIELPRARQYAASP